LASNSEVLGELIKHGKAEIQSLVTETFKPIIDPLKEIKNDKPTTNQPIELSKDKNFETEDFNIIDWFKSYDIDKTYGPKRQKKSSIHLGKKEINTRDNTVTIEDTSYQITQGLGNLIFSKNPKLYTNNDLRTYKFILTQTSAHLTADGKKIKKRRK